MTDLTSLTLSEARDGLAKKSFTSVELTEAHIAAIEAARGLNVFVMETPEQARNMGDQEKFRSVEQMVELAKELRAALEKDNLGSFGDILDQGWRLKRGLASGISNDVVETNYSLAREAGAGGGKLLGAGAGGFLLLICEPEKQRQVREALAGLREMPFTLMKSPPIRIRPSFCTAMERTAPSVPVCGLKSASRSPRAVMRAMKFRGEPFTLLNKPPIRILPSC